MKLQPNTPIEPKTFDTIQNNTVSVPDANRPFFHLQFRRFSGCPICNIHLRTFVKRKEELEAAGVHEVIFFHSSKDEMQKYQKDVPFDLVADPTKKHYREFGVETSVFAGLHPKAIWAGLRGAARGFITTKSEGGVHGLPADFLIDREGQIVAVKYGSHAYDQWSVSEVLELVKSQSVNSDQ